MKISRTYHQTKQGIIKRNPHKVKKTNWKEAYNILNEYFDSISDEEQPKLDKELNKAGNNYEKKYHIFMEYWDSMPDEEKSDIDKRLKKVGV